MKEFMSHDLTVTCKTDTLFCIIVAFLRKNAHICSLNIKLYYKPTGIKLVTNLE